MQKSDGLSGGLVNSWNATLFYCIGTAQCKNWIWTQMDSVGTKAKFSIVNVYSTLSLREKRKMWLELEEILKCCPGELVCIV